MDNKEQAEAFYARIYAHDMLLRMLVVDCQLRDPQFAERSRKALDIALGKLTAENHPLPVEMNAKM